MKRISLHYIVIIALSLSAVSCEFFGGGKSSQLNLKEVESIEQLQDTVKKLLDTQDALYAGLAKKIDTMATALKTTDSNFKTLEKQVAALREPTKVWNYITLGCCILVLLILVLIIHIYSFVLDKNQVVDIFGDYLGRSKRILDLYSRLDVLEQKVTSKVSSNNIYVPSNETNKITQLEQRITKLETLLNNHQERNPVQSTSKRERNPKAYYRIGYADTNSEQYFLDISDTKQEKSVFEIKFKNENEGIFDIISLDKIRSSNYWTAVVEATGCQMSEAVDYVLEEYGVCKKVEGSNWEVVKKLKIKLRK